MEPKNHRLAVFILLGAFALGILFNFFFVWKVPGLSLSLYFLIIFLIVQIGKRIRDGRFQFQPVELLYIPLFLVTLVPLLTQNYILTALSVLVTMFCGTYVLILHLWGRDISRFNFVEMLLLTIFHQMIQFGYFFFPFSQLRLRKANIIMHKSHAKLLLKIIAGFLIAVPLLLCFFILFASADAAFSQIFHIDLRAISNFFSIQRVWELAILFIVTLWWIGYLAAGYYYRMKDGDSKPTKATYRVVDPVVSTIVSVLLNLLFLCFVIVQFVYLFAGQSNIQRLGITYADYARQGFVELLIVAGISLAVVYLLRKFGSFRSAMNNLVLQVSLLVQIIFTLIVLVSAYYRMDLYQRAYGFTDIRLFVYAFLIFIAVILIYLAIAIFAKPALRYFSIFTFIIACVFMFGLAIVNPDAYVAKANIKSYLAGEILSRSLDSDYIITDLSSDGYSNLLDLKEITDNQYAMCKIARAWADETKHRSSFQELNLTHQANTNKVNNALAGYLNSDGSVNSKCNDNYREDYHYEL